MSIGAKKVYDVYQHTDTIKGLMKAYSIVPQKFVKVPKKSS